MIGPLNSSYAISQRSRDALGETRANPPVATALALALAAAFAGVLSRPSTFRSEQHLMSRPRFFRS